MSRKHLSICIIAASMLPATALSQLFLSQYKGVPYHDSRYQGGPQKLPGRVLCAYYDLGGEGVAYHDTDLKNHSMNFVSTREWILHIRSSTGSQIRLTTIHSTRLF